MHDPHESHPTALKRIIRYLQGTTDHGLLLPCSTSVFELVVYTNADWVGCLDTRRSTSGYAVFLGDNLVSWPSKRQKVVSRSSVEAEYRIVANGVAEACRLRQLLQELHGSLHRSTLVYCDNTVLSTYPLIQFSIIGRSMLRWISILSVSRSLLVKFVFSMFLPPLSLQTSSRKGFLPPCFLSSRPVSTFTVARCFNYRRCYTVLVIILVAS
jgi:hypothetical protein